MSVVAYDTETTGLHPYEGDEMFSYCVTDWDGNTAVCRLDGSPVQVVQSRERLERLWTDTSIAKTMHNAKFDITMTERFLGRKLDGHPVHCTHKMAHIMQNHHHDLSLDHLCWELAGYPRQDAAMRRLAKKCGGYDRVPKREMTAYQVADGERGMLLYRFFQPKIYGNPRWRSCYETEMDLVWTTMRMEERGMMICREAIWDLIKELEIKVDDAREKLFKLVGKRFNPGSDQQLREVLFKRMKFPVLKVTAKSKEAATDKDVIRRLRESFDHPVLELILQIRSYSKGITTLCSYLDVAGTDDILHPTINTCGAITGRESSEHPNLQNVQKTNVLLNPYPVAARKAFRPRPGYFLILLDYSGIEMRLLIFYSREQSMIDCLNFGDGDVHSMAAEIFYGERFRTADKKTRKSLRSAAKNANFATPYGAGWRQVAKTLGVSESDGERVYRDYCRAFPKLVGLGRTVSGWVLADGCVNTPFGRTLNAPRNKAYVGLNYLIQGTAAEIIKRAQNRIHRYNVAHTGGEVHLLLAVHDEVLIEYPRNRLKELPGYLRDVRALMVDFPEFDIPLEVEAQIATKNWEQKRPLPITVG